VWPLQFYGITHRVNYFCIRNQNLPVYFLHTPCPPPIIKLRKHQAILVFGP
jgi:hypothetical protein